MIRIAQLLLVLAAVGLWVASRLPWVVLRSFDGLGQPRTTTLTGATWSTALIPCAVLLLAAAIAAIAVRGWPLRFLALLVAVVSAGTTYLAITLWTVRDAAPRAASLVDLPVVSLVGSARHHWGAGIALASAVATLLAAVLLMRAAVKGGPITGKYTSPAQRRAVAVEGGSSETMSERMMWEALDHGDDPTRDSGSEGR